MNTPTRILPLVTAILLAQPAIGAELADPAPTPETPARLSWEEILTGGAFSADIRLRYEYANQSGLDASHAQTARTRLGYGTNTNFPLTAFLELEDIRAFDSDSYNQAGTNNQPGKTVIPDVETTELNQAYLNLTHFDWTARLGRQRVVLDNHRFVGNVGWRQNEQTFDAGLLRYQPLPDTTATFAYIDQVNRIFGREHPQGRWDSDSYLFDFRHPIPGAGIGGVYAYLLRFDDAPAMSANTIGISLRPNITILEQPFSLHLELARQDDNSASPGGTDFAVTYFRGEMQTDIDRFTLGAGYELLGSDRTSSFQTPLATLHAFNGWTDQFLQTPAQGLQDVFVHATARLPAKFTGRAGFHHFTSHRDSLTFGNEVNFLVSRPIGQHTSALVKAAFFDGKEGRPDVTKLWLQTDLRF